MLIWERIRPRPKELFGVDLRSLAVLRMGLGLSICLVIATYARAYRDLIANDGVLPFDVARIFWSPAAALLLEPFRLAPGIFEWVLAVWLIAWAVCLLLGFHARLACAAAWLGIYCLHVRNFPVTDYGDEVLVRVLFWSMFVPLGARWSLDARKQSRSAPIPNPHLSVAGVALLVQIACVYLVAGVYKSGPDWHGDATAIAYVMNHHYWATPYSAWLLEHPALTTLASRGTPPFEIGISLLLFLPIATVAVRMLAVVILIGFHLVLTLFITLGVAPFISIVSILVFLPGAFWDRLGAHDEIPDGSAPIHTPMKATASRAWRTRREILLLLPASVMLLYIYAKIADDIRPLSPPVRLFAETLRVDQMWAMYSPNAAHRDGWFIGEGILAKLARVDVLRGGQPVREQPPDAVPWAGDSLRWGIFRESLLRYRVVMGPAYHSWLCRDWNRRHRGGERLVSLKLSWMSVDRSIGIPRRAPERVELMRGRCDEPEPPAG